MAKKYTSRKSVSLSVGGLEEMLSNVQRAGRSVDSAVKKAIQESTKPIYNDIEAWAKKHELTGVMLKGVDQSVPQQEGNFISSTVGVDDDKSPGAWHATFVEHGTPTQAADPGIRQAFERNASKVKRIQRDVLKREGMPID